MPHERPTIESLNNRRRKYFCDECGKPPYHHILTWGNELMNRFLPPLPRAIFYTKLFDQIAYGFFVKLFILLRLGSLEEYVPKIALPPRSILLIQEAKKRGVICKVFRGPFGYTNCIQMQASGKTHYILGLPTADFLSKIDSDIIDDKERTKEYLRKHNFPIAKGASFWIWQKQKALYTGIREVGFPLVVKPRSGTQSEHVTTNITTPEQLHAAIKKVNVYSPAFIVERFMPGMCVHRATVIDFDYIACVKQVPAHIVGDGISTIQSLIDKKNNDPKRGEEGQKGYTLHKLIINDVSKVLLKEKGYSFSSIPAVGECVYLQKDSFLKLGGDLVDVTLPMHPDNREFFRKAAQLFDIRIVGIDFLIADITRSWRLQSCAILELNDAPCIDMHHSPSVGESQNVAGAVMDLFFKYYI